MHEMPLASRHRIQNSRPTTLLLGHNIESLRVSGEKHFVSLKLKGHGGVETRDLRPFKQAASTLTARGSTI